MYQESDWEEVQSEDVKIDKDTLNSLCAESSIRPTYEHLTAMEKVFNKVCKELDNFLLSIYFYTWNLILFYV